MCQHLIEDMILILGGLGLHFTVLLIFVIEEIIRHFLSGYSISQCEEIVLHWRSYILTVITCSPYCNWHLLEVALL